MRERPALVLVAAVLVVAACRGSQPAAPPAATSAAPPAAAAEAGLAAFLPPAGSPAGWVRSKPPQAYTADTLWEFIDGAAETYVGFGFQEALSVGYSSGGADVGIEIYQMADALHAFGIFAQERPPSPQAAGVGVEGYINSNVLNFWKGACYVKLIAPQADRPGPAALAALARAIAEKIPAGAALPRELSAFPAANLVPNSVKFVPRDVLGQQYLANGFEAGYTDGAVASRLVVVPCATPDEAASALKRYRAFVAIAGKAKPALTKVGDEAFSGEDRFNGRVFAARAGAVVAISVGAASDAAASTLVGAYFNARHQDTP